MNELTKYRQIKRIYPQPVQSYVPVSSNSKQDKYEEYAAGFVFKSMGVLLTCLLLLVGAISFDIVRGDNAGSSGSTTGIR